MAWVGVITNSGRALLDSYAGGGHTLTLTDVTVGSGTVAEANLRIQTALTSEKDEGSIISVEEITGGTKYKLQVSPASASVGAYTAHQIGLWAKLDSGIRTLLLLAQDADAGVSIPLASVSPNFAFAIFAALAVDNTGDLTVNIDQSAYVTEGTLDEALAEKVDVDAIADENVNTITEQSSDYPALTAGDKLAVIVGKIKKWLSGLKAKLDGIESGAQVNSITGVKGDSESSYRTGNVNLTAGNIGAKSTQTAVSDPTASGTSATFIATISQNAQGVITPTKKTVQSASQSAAGLMSATDKAKLDGIAAGAQVNSITGVKGDSESIYRTGNVNLTAGNIGAVATSAIIDIPHGGTGQITQDGMRHAVFGNTTTSGITTYPTTTGLFRLTGTLPTGMPSGASGYGVLTIVGAGGYFTHRYVDANHNVYYAYRSEAGAPITWRKLTSTNGDVPLTVAQGGTGSTGITETTVTFGTTDSIITAKSGKFYRWGKVVQLYLSIKIGATSSNKWTLGSNANTVLTNVPVPKSACRSASYSGSVGIVAGINTDSNPQLQLRNTDVDVGSELIFTIQFTYLAE